MASFDRLFISEKDSVAQSIADWLSRNVGQPIQRGDGFYRVGGDCIVPMRGHLLSLIDAEEYDPRYKQWRFSDLPIVPATYRYKVIDDDKGFAKKRVALIARMLKECRLVVGAGDQDAEGQLIQDELLEFLGNTKPVVRFWTNALSDQAILDAMSNLKPNSDFRGWRDAAECRSHADWSLGINATRAFTTQARDCGYRGVVNIGRVQTPTLWLPYMREMERLAFKPRTFFTPQISCATTPGITAKWIPHVNEAGEVVDPRLDAEQYLVDRNAAQAIVNDAQAAGKAMVTELTVEGRTKAPPLPFSLSGLQAHCDLLFNLTATETLAIAQKLYINKITSYPRVECKYLDEREFPLAREVLRTHMSDALPEEIKSAINGCRFQIKSKAWDSEKTTAHTAIAPVQLSSLNALASLSEMELKVYHEILKRFALQFWPAAKLIDTKAILSCPGPAAVERYRITGKQVVDPGWMDAFQGATIEAVSDGNATQGKDGEDGESNLPKLEKGMWLQINRAFMTEGTTEKPKRFTEGTLIMAMENIYRYVSNPEYRARLQAKDGGGIGTGATRAPTIEGLVKKGFLTREGKKKELVPTETTMKLLPLIPKLLCQPDTTAMWQMVIDEVQAGRRQYDTFISNIHSWVGRVVQTAATSFKPGQFGPSPSEAGGQHQCFGQVGKVGCGAPLRLIPDAPGKYKAFYGCTNPDCRKTFRADNGKPVEQAPRLESPPDAEKISCPGCGKGHMLRRQRNDKSGYFWGCSGYRDGCRTTLPDEDGKPGAAKAQSGGSAPAAIDQTHACPRCGKGFLQARKRKDESQGSFWSCSAWREGCNFAVDDANGTPDIHNSKRYTQAGAPRINRRTGVPR